MPYKDPAKGAESLRRLAEAKTTGDIYRTAPPVPPRPSRNDTADVPQNGGTSRDVPRTSAPLRRKRTRMWSFIDGLPDFKNGGIFEIFEEE